MPISDIDILNVANVLLKRHGRDAAIVAAMKVDECLAADDLEGRMIWKRIVEALLGLLKEKPDEGERVN